MLCVVCVFSGPYGSPPPGLDKRAAERLLGSAQHCMNFFSMTEPFGSMDAAMDVIITVMDSWMPTPLITPQVLHDAAVADGDALDVVADPAKHLVPASSPDHPRYRPPQSRRPAETSLLAYLGAVARRLSTLAYVQRCRSQERIRAERRHRDRTQIRFLMNTLNSVGINC